MSWANDAVRSMNEMYGQGDVFEEGNLTESHGQRLCLNQLRDVYKSVDVAPSSTPAEAFDALCGAQPGYEEIPAERVTFKRDRVSLPPPGIVLADGEHLLAGEDLEAWTNWRSVLLRTPAELQEARVEHGEPIPYTDANLRKKPKAYAEFVKSLITRNLIELAGLQGDHGGFGVTCKKIDKQTVGEQGQVSKRWRYGVEDFVSARR